ncbi:nitrile hydratase subunit beta [Roseomonas gilardii]|uniref:Nitrile hydratase subunit beta n=1 Tax=Roseomonas gilardii TaxID=257708 RepID=A0ABU3MLW3_9PROT|nr:SH3-like domain-containing protein [Roseomonas gilardii]MDT8333461.1 nitrile hydratase subunit beta [Roseomonas gilardii]
MNGAAPPGAVLVPGTRVRVRFDWPESRGPAHIRTPHYLRGREGTVLAHLGDFPDPSELAFGRPAPLRALYHVAFAQPALFGTAPSGIGREEDSTLVELYGHWLEPLDEEGRMS